MVDFERKVFHINNSFRCDYTTTGMGSNNSQAAMFEAGYKTGFFDGARNVADGAQQSA